MTAEGWIFLDNLKPFVFCLADYAKYELSDGDLYAIEYGVKDSDFERDRWYEYEFSTSDTLKFRLAYDRGSSVMFYRVESRDEAALKIKHVADIMSEYILTKGPVA